MDDEACKMFKDECDWRICLAICPGLNMDEDDIHR